jgi:uncharacterized membrane protein
VRLQALTLIAGLAGVGVSVYLTAEHYAGFALACPSSALINCEQVLTSPYAVVAGSTVPTAAAGILWFAASAALSIALLAGLPWLRAQVVWSSIGVLSVLYLVFVEIVRLGAICIWCTAAHVLVLAIFIVSLTIATRSEA